jgi:hypothetical protein
MTALAAMLLDMFQILVGASLTGTIGFPVIDFPPFVMGFEGLELCIHARRIDRFSVRHELS